LPADAVLGENVGRILLTVDLAQVHTLRPNSLLYPKSVRIKVAQLAEALPVAYAYGSA
jgi:hypothetical protein